MNRLPLLMLGLLVACSGGGGDDDTKTTTSPADTDADTDTDTDADADTDTDADADADADTDSDTDTDTGTVSVTVPDVTGDAATVPLNGECALDERYGGFLAEVLDIYSVVSGDVADGVVPITVLEEVGTEGDCVLLKRNNPFCDPPCQAGETCDFDGECIPYPTNQELGVVTVGGMVDDVVMTAVQPGTTYFDTSLTHPAFDPGELIELRTHGSTFGDVELHGVGVEPLSLTNTEWVLYDQTDFDVAWTVGGATDRDEIHLRLTIDQHGVTPVSLYCAFEDDGQGTIPGSLIGQLIASGVTGFPNAIVTRRTVDSATVGAGCMEFVVSSPQLPNPDIRVDGFTPCTSSKDCPQGQVCDVPNEICIDE